MTVLRQGKGRTTTGATAAAAAFLLLTSGAVLAGSATPVSRPSGSPYPSDAPYPTDAPGQRYGTAAGQAHLVGGQRNTVVPPSLRSRYPLASASTATPTGRNKAIVAAAPRTEATGFDPASSREAAGERDAHTRVWRNADGTDTTEIGTRPLNYRTADGSWQPIDSRLVQGAGGWHTAADEVELRLPAVADEQRLATVALPGAAAVEFGLRDAARVTGRSDGAAVVYPGIRPRTDLRLEGMPGGVKETLVLHDASAPTVFTYPLRLTGLGARMDGGGVAFVDGAGVRRATIPAGFMADSAAEPATSTAVSYRLVDDGTALEVALDPSWLQDPARRYPVLVDPSVETGAADASMVVRGGSSVSGGSELQVGGVGGVSTASYLRFDGLATRLRNHKIFGAQLQVFNFDAASCRPRAVTVHPVTQPWSPTTSVAFPGPAVGPALAMSSFAYGYIAVGQSTSACPSRQALFGLGAAGRDLVQGWADGQPNNGLSLRASTTDPAAGKRFAGSSTANPPRLFVTHSAYDAGYTITNPVPNPPVLQNQAGKVKITVTNKGAETWTAATYYLAYRVFRADTGALVTSQRAASLPGSVTRGARATLDATIQPLPVGKYMLDFTMVRSGGPVFTDEQVPPARILLQVFNIPPVVQELQPPNGYQSPTLTPQLWARAVDVDAPPASSLRFRFVVCDGDGTGAGANCLDSGSITSQAWTVPAGRLSWTRTYQWRAFVKDGLTEVASPWSVLLTWVPQPEITSRVAGGPYGSQDRDFDPQTGNVSTAAVDASVATPGPALEVARTYNSLDPRRDLAFGAGWSTVYDMRVVPDDDGSGNVVVTYADGQQVRFGHNPDGTFAAPQGRVAGLALTAGAYTLSDRSGRTYQFSGAGKLTRVADAAQRAVTLTYSLTDGRLAQAKSVVGPSGAATHTLTFTWTGNHVTTVKTDPATAGGTAPSWTYTYSGDVLTKACGPDSACTTYTYGAGSHYRTAVLDDRPQSYYRLGEAEGPGAGSEVAVNLGKDAGTYTAAGYGAVGALAGTDDTAVAFNGTTSQLALPEGQLKANRDGAVEMWLRISLAQTGGPLLGYQDLAVTGAPAVGWPLLYVGTDGRLRGQFRTGTIAPITSAGTVNDNRWHHVVLSAMGSTQTLWLDGVRVGTLTGAIDHAALTFAQVGAGYATAPASWPAWGTTTRRFFNGAIDELAVYNHPLGAPEVGAHLRAAAQADQLTRITLPSGKVAATAVYDVAQDRLREYTDGNGGTWTLRAPAVGGGAGDLRRVVELLDPARRPYLYEYDALAGRLLRTGTPVGIGTRQEDLPGFPAPSPTPTQTCPSPDPNDPSFCLVPPGSGGPTIGFQPADGMAIRSMSYNPAGLPAQVTNEVGQSVWFGYDARGNLTSRKTCRSTTDCQTASYTYPATVTNPFDPRNDMPLEYRDGRSNAPTDNRFRTQYTYTPTGALAGQTNADGGAVTNRYTTGAEAAVGGGVVPPALLRSTTDPRGAVTTYDYTSAGDLARITAPTGLVTSYGYDGLGRLVQRTETSDAFPSGVVATFGYDARSRLTTTTGPATTDAVTGARHQLRTTTTYDTDGNATVVEQRDLLTADPVHTTKVEYDDRNRPVRATDAEAAEAEFGYDAFGNVTSTVDGNGVRTEYAYSARNAVTEVRLRNWTSDAPGSGAPAPGDYLVLDSYAYDFAGRTARHSDAAGHRVEYAYYGDDLLAKSTLKGFHNPDGTTRDFVLDSRGYDGAGNLLTSVTGNGRTTTAYTYTAVGQVASVSLDPAGLNRTTTFSYDTAGNITRTVSTGNASNVGWTPANTSETVTYGYDTPGNLFSETVDGGAVSRTTRYDHDQRGLVTATTDPRGTLVGADPTPYTSTFRYDELGRMTVSVGAPVSTESAGGAPQTEAPTASVGYDAFGAVVAEKDARGAVVRTAYDRVGRPVTVTLPAYTPPGRPTPLVPTISTGYDAVGNVSSVTDPLRNLTRYSYDQLGRLTAVDQPASTNAERAVWSFGYARTGEPLSVTDPTGARTEATYDDLGRRFTASQLERKPTAATLTTRYAYDDAGNVTGVTSPSTAASTSAYDALGQLTQQTDPSGVVSRYGYDFAGRAVRTADGAGRTSRTDYDAFGAVSTVTDIAPDATVLRSSTFTYDAAGNPATVSDPLRRATTFTYDAGNRLVRQVEPATPTSSITTTFGYDAAGNRTRLTDGRGNATVSTYNVLGLLESVIEPSTPAHPAAADRTWTAGYDEAGRPVSVVAPGGVARQRTFDAAGRLGAESAAGGGADPAARSAKYDLAGRLVQVDAPGGTDTFAYNDRGALLSTAGPSGAAGYAYDADGQPLTRTDAAGTARYTYLKGRLATVTDGATGTAQTLHYDPTGRPDRVDYGAGRVRTMTYDNLGRTATDTLRNAAGTAVSDLGYTYDVADQLTQERVAGLAGAGTETFGYDLAGRLASWTAGGRTTAYGWDAAGNRTSAGAATATYDARNRLLSDAAGTYTYTPRGTLASKRDTAGATQTLSFDGFDRMTKQGTVGYAYDGLDRVASRSGTAFTYGGLSDDVVADGTATYGRGPGGEVTGVARGASKRFALGDGHGDVVGGFDPADTTLGAVPDSRAYDPFGAVTASTGTPTAVGYQGDWTDPSTGQVDVGARWYAPGSGVFVSRDPFGYGGGDSVLANRYTYAAAAPTINVDPDGYAPRPTNDDCLQERTFTGGACVGIGGGLGGGSLGSIGPLLPPSGSSGGTRNGGGGDGSGAGSGGGSGAGGGSRSGGSSAGGGASSGVSSAAQARTITERARHAAAWAAQHNPRPNLSAATRPLYTGSAGRLPVSSSPTAPAGRVGASRNVVADQAKASNELYQRAWDATGPVVRDMPAAAQQVSAAPAGNTCGTPAIQSGPYTGGGSVVALGLAPNRPVRADGCGLVDQTLPVPDERTGPTVQQDPRGVGVDAHTVRDVLMIVFNRIAQSRTAGAAKSLACRLVLNSSEMCRRIADRTVSAMATGMVTAFCAAFRGVCDLPDPDYIALDGSISTPFARADGGVGVVLTRTGHVYEQRSLGFGISPLPIPGGGSVALGYIFDPYGNRAYRYDIDPFVGGFGITGRIGVSGGSVSPGSDLQAKEYALSTDAVSVSVSAAREIRDLGSDIWH